MKKRSKTKKNQLFYSTFVHHLSLHYRKWVVMAVFFIYLALVIKIQTVSSQSQTQSQSWWNIQAVDTMKLSRDLAREKRNDPSYDRIIEAQMKQIKDVGATHAVIATPYDAEFIPFLRRWVLSARKQGLHVWFRGNFSGWEGWFFYSRITREEHSEKVIAFIKNNPDLFEDGDIFTSCPECENGGPGDPRKTGDVAGHRQFLINDYEVTTEAFKSLGKNIRTNLYSMNGDVAKLIMNEETTKQLGGFITVDHYVKDAAIMKKDLSDFYSISNGSIIIGEFGSPVPDLHGNQTAEEQKNWLEDHLRVLAENKHVVGINYWVGTGGSTMLWSEDASSVRPAAEVLKKYFIPHVYSGTIQNELGESIENAIIKTSFKETVTNKKGVFSIAYLPEEQSAAITAPAYLPEQIQLDQADNKMIILKKEHEDWFFKLKRLLFVLFPSSRTFI